MIKKGCLFSFVVVCSLFFLTACPKAQESNEPTLEVFKEQNVPFDTLLETGFVPPVIRLPDSYVNDKIESKAKKLSYEFYYRVLTEDEDFSKVTAPAEGYLIHSATIAEEDAGDASKTKIKYDKLRAVNGGDICVGTKFVIGLIVKDQSDNLVYHSISKYVVFAPKAKAGESNNTITVAGDQTGFKDLPTASEGAIVSKAEYTKDTSGRTVYTLTSATGKRVSLTYGEFGSTNKVLVK